MTSTINIQPITRIEGHARLVIQLDDASASAFEVNEDAHRARNRSRHLPVQLEVRVVALVQARGTRAPARRSGTSNSTERGWLPSGN